MGLEEGGRGTPQGLGCSFIVFRIIKGDWQVAFLQLFCSFCFLI